ncbi:N-acetyltransferase [Bacillus sp. C11]|nr:N-acetyltransferase [Neobacillus terrae]
MKIDTEIPEQLSAIRQVNNLAFEREGEANLVDAIRNSEFFIPGLSLVALNEEDEVVGHILFSKVFIETDEDTITTIALAPMAVKPDYQGQGVGSLLVREGLKKCRALNFNDVIVLGHSRFYPKFGFLPASNYGITPPFDVPDNVFMAKELRKDSLKDISGRVRYPEAFNNV